MLKLITFKTPQRVVNLENENLSVQEANLLFEALNGNITAGYELVMTLDFNSEVLNLVVSFNGLTVLTVNNTVAETNNSLVYISKKTGTILDAQVLKSRVINVQNLDIKSLTSSIEQMVLQSDPQLSIQKKDLEVQSVDLSTKIENSIQPENKEKYSRIQEINSRIESIQSQIDFYQNEKKLREASNLKVKKLTTEKQSLSQLFQSAELLIKSKEELQTKLNAYSPSQIDLSQVENLKMRKAEHTKSHLSAQKLPVVNNSINDEEPKKPLINFKLNFNVSLVLTFVNIGLALLAFLYSYSFSVLLIGLVGSVVLMTIYIISRFFTDSLEDLEKEDNSEDLLVAPVQNQDFSSQPDPNTQLFLNAAWVKAINNEILLIDENINKNLNGEDYTSIKTKIDSVDKEIELENQKLEDMNKKSITSDEYYKKRRELDILKIEKENLEFTLKLDPELDRQLTEIKSKLQEVSKTIEFSEEFRKAFPVFVSGPFNTEQLSSLKQSLLSQQIVVIGI